ncbi:sensor histidine kinase [Paenibacillus xerothermodurans]|nr:HAMP domain-containing sensor histidine kinase [Paenibacillus xerothermodurans]
MRIYLMVFGLIALMILFFSYRMITVSSEAGIQREYAASLDRHAMFYNALKMYASTMDQISYNPNLEHKMLTQAVQNYGLYYTDNKSHVAMTNEAGEKLYSSILPDDEHAMGLTPAKDGRRSYVIRSVGSRTVLFVSGWVDINGKLFRLDFTDNITNLIADLKSLARQMSLWLSVGMVMLALGLYVLIRQALHPLAQLSTQAQAIAKGRYDHRITVKRDDEIGQLAVDFNHMADAIQANTALLQRAVQERERFIASLAHELKTPLTSIMGYADLLQYYQLDEQEVTQALQFIRNESKRLDDISIKLLEMFRLGAGPVLNKQVVPVFSLMQQAELITKLSLSRKRQRLDIKSSITEVAVDQELFLLLLSNLIENASRASDNDAVISIQAYPRERSVVFCVRDNGCGIPAEHLDDVLQPFFMLDGARDGKKKGHGLGLSLSKAIAEAHGGRLDMKSRLGEGTTVYALIPNQENLQNDDIPPMEP